jgi:hypothetical protein
VFAAKDGGTAIVVGDGRDPEIVTPEQLMRDIVGQELDRRPSASSIIQFGDVIVNGASGDGTQLGRDFVRSALRAFADAGLIRNGQLVAV